MNKENTAIGSELQPLPGGPHAAYDHDRTNDADALVLGHSAGELFADHYVHVILRGGTEQERSAVRRRQEETAKVLNEKIIS